MKRIVIATTLFAVALIICFCEFRAVDATENYKNTLDKISALSENGEFEEAYILSADVSKRWQTTQKKLNKYLYHDYVDNITLELTSLSIYTQNADVGNIRTTVNNAKIKLASLKESELLHIYNIL